ncbi:hypothetical protein CfE428DRAFT_4617 [Chthoniobacter flavus Ellin428]|uniref:Uncharacterized protein n=1 Tax=Chthoniobacter flavus Ellin428 TaxID=497964 RepID=B4D6S7_9BACT|nr:hypothetical protein [Chthoniobacter flavus]EDY17878.1 hypothetical protein CfE428DRAFT_4617 [Chthoniobacter flavus Ellin428]TCO88488.1 hypothetical protein EV701_11790 [Chthoniobacter flavus]
MMPSFFPLRSILGVLAATIAFAFSSFTSTASAAATIVLDVKTASTVGAPTTNYRSRNGSYDTSFDRERTVDVTLRAIGIDQPRPINVQIWWIGQLQGSTTKVVLHKNTTTKNVSSSAPQSWQEISGEVKGRDRNLRGIHYRKQTGARILGWIVQADGDGLHAVQASEASLQALAGTQALKDMETAAETK